jgi:hypothetical protein
MHIRAFGMSGAQIATELKQLEESLDLKIRSNNVQSPARKHNDYQNFESKVRQQAAWMSEYYEIFYCLEVSIRKLISTTLTEAEGSGWWSSSRVSNGIRNEVEVIRRKESNSGLTPRSDRELDYTTFGQLSQLITDNFELFEPTISSKSAVSRVLNQLNLLRGPIAHCSPLAEDERDRLELSIRDWFRLLS